MDDLKKGDLVCYLPHGSAFTDGLWRGIVLGESRCGAGYRVRWLADGKVGECYRRDLAKIEVEGD